MEIEVLKIDKLIPYARNSRTHSPEQIKQIAASIREFGFTNPILIDEKDTIIAGHGRVSAAEKLDMDELPCIRFTHLSEAQKKAYRIADNKLALNAGWTDDMLKLDLEELRDKFKFDIDVIGFSEQELDALFVNKEVVEDDFDVDAAIPEIPIAKRGDVWQLGRHRLMCGDSTVSSDVDKLMNGNKADMVFTDPPYGLDYSGGRTQVVKEKMYGKLKNDNLQNEQLGNLIEQVFNFNKAEADIYICVSPIVQKPFLDFIVKQDRKIDAVIVWDKKNAGLGYMAYRRQCEFILFIKGSEFKKGDKSDFDLWSISKDNTSNYLHGTQKPIAISSRAINNSSKQDDLIADYFGGSGSTLIACEQTNRICYMMELDEKYCDVIIKRWESFTGKKAELIGN
jgi:DNA modification methylase